MFILHSLLSHFCSGCIRMNEMNPHINHFTFSSKQVKKQEKDDKNLQQQKLPQIVNQSTIKLKKKKSV